ncbi:MAG: TMEM43 family protein [Desulfobulbus sp.]
MEEDSFTEVTSQSWGGRLGGSLKGIVIGLLLICVGIAALLWNEGRAVDRARALEEGAGQIVTIEADRIDPAYEGRLVHLSGNATTQERLSDPDFGVQAQAIKLHRAVQMFQWQEHRSSETKEKLGGGTETVTTYTYDKGWNSRVIQSSSFKKPTGHQNPGHMPYQGWSSQAREVTLGAFRLSSGLISQINQTTSIPLNPESGVRLPSDQARLSGDEIYIGQDPASPSIGDIRIGFQAVYPTDVSIVSVQRGESFTPYTASNGNVVELLEYGFQTAQQMFQAAQGRNTLLTWGIRLAGFIGVFIGFRMLLGTLRVLAAVVPMFGRLVGGALGILAFIIAAVISLVSIAIAWIFYRPLLAVGLLVGAGVLLFGLKIVKSSDKVPAAPSMTTATPPPPPPPSPA